MGPAFHPLFPVIYVPCLLSPAWLARKAHSVTLDMSTSISGPGEPSPQPILTIYSPGLREAQRQLSQCVDGPAGVLLSEDCCEGALGLSGQKGHRRLVCSPETRGPAKNSHYGRCSGLALELVSPAETRPGSSLGDSGQDAVPFKPQCLPWQHGVGAEQNLPDTSLRDSQNCFVN